MSERGEREEDGLWTEIDDDAQCSGYEHADVGEKAGREKHGFKYGYLGGGLFLGA